MPSFKVHIIVFVAAFTSLNGISAASINSLFSRHSASGINCEGSADCIGYKGELRSILDKVNQIAIGKTFNSGGQLACAGFNGVLTKNGHTQSQGEGLCASVGHNTPSFTVGASTNGQSNSAGDIIEDLIYHGCEACGTAPTNRQGNKLSEGSISVNYVTQVCYCSDDNPCGS